MWWLFFRLFFVLKLVIGKPQERVLRLWVHNFLLQPFCRVQLVCLEVNVNRTL